MQYISYTAALEYVQREAGLSRDIFDLKIRPRLVERKYTDRVIRFSRLDLEKAVADPEYQEDAMFKRKKTVDDALDLAWNVKWKDARGANQKENLKEHVSDDLGGLTLDKITYARVQEWVLSLRDRKHGKKRKPYAISTIDMRLSCLYTALDLAKKQGWIDKVPDRPPLPGKVRKERYLTPEEEKRLFAKVPELDWPTSRRLMPHVLAFLIDTGCRRSELIKVRRADLSDDGVIFRDRKAGNSIKVPLTARARQGIDTLLSDPSWQRRTEGTLDSPTRRQTVGDWLSSEFVKLRTLAGLPDVTLHTCRHTCGSRLVQRGMDLFRVQKWLGHKDIQSTQIYAHLQPTDLASGAHILESYGDNNVVGFQDRRIRDE